MGHELAKNFKAAALVFEEADDVLGFYLSQIAWEGPEEVLRKAKNAQPALLIHSEAVLRVVGDELGEPVFSAGHSLGEFSAHLAAGTMSFRDALEVVRLRGELMYATGTQRPGGMAAVLGLKAELVKEICAQVQAEGRICVLANFNSPQQVVISGEAEGMREGMARVKEAGAKRVMPPNVSGAFHSPLMSPAEEGLREKLAGVNFSDPTFPVISNVTAEAVHTGAEAKEFLVKQLTSPVRWSALVTYMVEAGVERFYELGTGTVLCGLNKRNASGVPCQSLGDPEDLEKLGH
jgi:[acyl-carrier-protein] S-malonyltransferase